LDRVLEPAAAESASAAGGTAVYRLRP